MNEFTVIPDEQTPATPEINNIQDFLSSYKILISEFKEYAKSRTDAIGLAANQCNINGSRFDLRICAIKDSKDPDRNCIIAIDPKIKRKFGILRTKFEGCLTWKNKVIVAERNHSIEVEYYTEAGGFVTETYKGFQAQVWQHEINHLNGIEEIVVHPRDLPKIEKEDIGRNEKCPCGSDRKYKQCCIEK